MGKSVKQPPVTGVVKALRHEFGVKPAEAHAIVRVVSEAWRDQVLRDGACHVPGLVTIRVRHWPARVGRDPRNGRPVQVPPKTTARTWLDRALRKVVLGAQE